MDIELSSEVKKDLYTDYIQEHYDLSVEDVITEKIPFNFRLDNLGNWNIGLICGGSGSGKSTIMGKLGKIKHVEFDNSKSIISNFNRISPQEVIELFCSVGLCSVPTWLKPYSVLSNGEKYRAYMAKLIYESKDGEIILVDEYTSVVDRNVAKSMSNALQKYIRKVGKKIILASCHYDIIEWLRPNWIYDLNKGGVLERGECLRRPKIELQMYRTEVDTWRMFKKHHYMTEQINKAAACFVFTWNGSVVGVVSTLSMFGKGINKAVREHRLVILPEFQGLGLGRNISEFIASIYKSEGYKYFTKTIHPKIGEYRNVSDKWIATPHNGKYRKDIINHVDKKYSGGKPRASYCHEYIGKPTFGCSDMIQKVDILREKIRNKGQLTLF